MPEVLDDVVEADVRPDDATEESENKNPRIFCQPPFEVVGLVPVGGDVDDGWRHDAEGGHLDGAQQRDEEVEPRNGGGKGNWKGKRIRQSTRVLQHFVILCSVFSCNFRLTDLHTRVGQPFWLLAKI